MIRDFMNRDLPCVMQLWFQTNIKAHPFIHRNYWQMNFNAVRESMEDASLYLFEDHDGIHGFIGLIDEFIAGIFVEEAYQSIGIGKKLLNYVKTKNVHLSLSVYKKNHRAIEFYLREKFIIVSERMDENTKEVEYCMEWLREH